MRARFGKRLIVSAGIALCAIAGLSSVIMVDVRAQPAAATGPSYTAEGRLDFPKDYRRWVYLSSGMDMSYLENAPAGMSTFGNVFVNPEAYDAFLKNGTWPDNTELVLEVRRAEQDGSINRRGHFQTGVIHSEVHVKDAARFNGGWGFFGFSDDAPAAMIPRTATCYSCHQDNGAVDTTFVQFYPTLLPVARSKKTLSAGYLTAEPDVK